MIKRIIFCANSIIDLEDSMVITDVKTFVVNMYRTNFIFIVIYTDEGISGVGEATTEYKERAVVGAVEDLSTYLIGKDPLQIELHSYMMYRESYWRMGAVLMSALSAVDTALWDIAGKYYNTPVYKLLGGEFRKEIPMYANGWFAGSSKPEQFAEKAKKAVSLGIKALKWDPFGKAYLKLSAEELVMSIDCVAAVRDAVGNSVDLLIEGHGRFNETTAIQISKELEPFSPKFFEEPVPPDNLDVLSNVHRKSAVPIAAGERIYSIYQCREFLEKGCADFFQPDVSHCGGITGLKKMAGMAEPYYVSLMPHNPSGPVANAATLQLAGVLPNFEMLEIMLTDVSWRKEITNEAVVFTDGMIQIPSKPGLGLELNEQNCLKYPFKPIALRHYNGSLTDIRPSGNTSYYFHGINSN